MMPQEQTRPSLPETCSGLRTYPATELMDPELPKKTSEPSSSGDRPTPEKTPIPTRVGPYRIEGRLGAGGMGAVYRAWDERLERWVAIKHVLPEVASDVKLRRRLRREARAAAALNHPSIVQIYDIIEQEEGDWIVMEFVEGDTLRRIVKRQRLPWRETARYGFAIAEGLAEAHAKGIVHRDLKTENVMITTTGQPKILDFGLAKKLVQGPQDTVVSVQGTILGTGRAMSPEQAKGEAIDHRSDIFSLGTLLYECLVGKAPFIGSSIVATLAQVCSTRQAPVRDLVAEVPAALSDLIDGMLSKHPNHRPQTTLEVASALGHLLGTTTDEALTQTSTELTRSRTSSLFNAPLSPSRVPDHTALPFGTAQKPSGLGAGVQVKTLLTLEMMGSGEQPQSLVDDQSYEVTLSHDRLVRDLLSPHGGVEVHRTDTFLLLFEEPEAAVRYALAYHDHLAGLTADLGVPLRGRVGIHQGEILLRDNTLEDIQRGAKPFEVEGRIKQAVSRIASLANPGQTLMTEAVYDRSKPALKDSKTGDEPRWQGHGRFELAGLGEPVHIYEIRPPGVAPIAPPGDTENAWRVEEDGTRSSLRSTTILSRAIPHRRPHRLALLLLLIVFVMASGFLAWRAWTPEMERSVVVAAESRAWSAIHAGDLESARLHLATLEGSNDVDSTLAALRLGSDIALLAGDVDEAKKLLTAARQEVDGSGEGDDFRLVLSELRLLLAEGKPDDVRTRAAVAAEQARRAGRGDDFLRATTLRVLAHLALNETADAEAALKAMNEPLAASETPEVRVHAQVARARWHLLNEDFANALQEAEAAVKGAAGLAVADFEARLTLGEIEILGGAGTRLAEEARQRLRELAQEAEGKGFLEVAARAHSAAEGHSAAEL